MSRDAQSTTVSTAALSAAERDWIRRQGMTARVLAAEQRRVRSRLADSAEVAAVRERFKRDSRAGDPLRTS